MNRFIGTVIEKNSSQLKVLVERRLMHCKLPKMICNREEFLVSDPSQQAVIGDTVAIEQTNTTNGFQLQVILLKGRAYKDPESGEIYTCK